MSLNALHRSRAKTMKNLLLFKYTYDVPAWCYNNLFLSPWWRSAVNNGSLLATWNCLTFRNWTACSADCRLSNSTFMIFAICVQFLTDLIKTTEEENTHMDFTVCWLLLCNRVPVWLSIYSQQTLPNKSQHMLDGHMVIDLHSQPPHTADQCVLAEVMSGLLVKIVFTQCTNQWEHGSRVLYQVRLCV